MNLRGDGRERAKVALAGHRASVTGANHRRHGQVNQDALRVSPANRQGARAVVAVADGHGGPDSPRSSTGAGLAVEIAVALIEERLEAPTATTSDREYFGRERFGTRRS